MLHDISDHYRHKWSTFRPSWPALPNPEPKPLDRGISLKSLLAYRL